MSKHLGDYDTSAVVYGKFTTYDPATGQPATLGTGASLAVYKNADAGESVAGVTLVVDFDAKTGLHHFTIDTSADGAFYAAGGAFDIVLASGSVGGVNVAGSAVASFSLRKDSGLKIGVNSGAVSFTGGLTISSAAGSALTLSSSGGNGHGLAASGNGSGSGLSGTGGVTGHGALFTGGATSGAGLLAEGSAGNANGIECVANGSGIDLAADNIAAIKAKTDSLAFTVAGQVDANVQYVNNVLVTGNGQPGTEWGP